MIRFAIFLLLIIACCNAVQDKLDKRFEKLVGEEVVETIDPLAETYDKIFSILSIIALFLIFIGSLVLID